MQIDVYANRIKEMKRYGSLKSASGEVSFLGMVRALEQGVNEFCVELAGRSPMCGEWLARFQSDGRDFSVEIVSFGYTSPRNVGNSAISAKQIFDRSEVMRIKALIEQLFASEDLRGKISPFSTKGAIFTGEIFYKKNWVREPD